MERAVAEVAAAGADPLWVRSHLVDVLPVSHKETVTAEIAEQALALRAGGTFAKCLLATLMAGNAVHLVIHLQPLYEADDSLAAVWQRNSACNAR